MMTRAKIGIGLIAIPNDSGRNKPMASTIMGISSFYFYCYLFRLFILKLLRGILVSLKYLAAVKFRIIKIAVKSRKTYQLASFNFAIKFTLKKIN